MQLHVHLRAGRIVPTDLVASCVVLAWPADTVSPVPSRSVSWRPRTTVPGSLRARFRATCQARGMGNGAALLYSWLQVAAAQAEQWRRECQAAAEAGRPAPPSPLPQARRVRDPKEVSWTQPRDEWEEMSALIGQAHSSPATVIGAAMTRWVDAGGDWRAPLGIPARPRALSA